MNSVVLEISDVLVEVHYNFSEGTEPYFDHGFGNWLPGESAFVDIEFVCLGVGLKKRDCKDQLSDAQIQKIRDQIFELETK